VIEVYDLPADPSEFFDAAYELGWTDGLPVIPPIPERVSEMLGGRPPQTTLGPVPPLGADLTYELIAINAVMAGCNPDLFAIVVTTMAAVLEPEFNLLGVQATTHPAGPVVIVNGPLRFEVGFASGTGCMGPGFRANATLGRAVRLCLLNVGGAVPGSTDLSTQAQPGKFTFVLAENEEESPWPPLSVARGLDSALSAVTVLAGESPRNINDVTSGASGLMLSLSASMTVPNMNAWYYDGNVLLLLCPEHAKILASGGLSREDLQSELLQRTRLARDRISPDIVEKYGSQLKLAGDQARIAAAPEDILVAVAGGAGRHSSFVASFGNTRAITKPISA
jgi:hypothetical protein